MSFLQSYVLDLLPQLPRASTSRHTSTEVGISRLIRAHFPSSHLLSQTTVFPQIGDMWNITLAQAVGGARSFCCTHTYTHISSSSRFSRGDRNGLKLPHVDFPHPPINRNARHSVFGLTQQLGRRRNRGWHPWFPPRRGFDRRPHSMVHHPPSALSLCAINCISKSPWGRIRPLASNASAFLPSIHLIAEILR